ncbi:aldo/keto reductase [Streptomyces sp. NPDC004296]|uniref:aldo/keto reductase n=1 Tax=Streptomyces sp. NPDC004296 TaxID=3364697 RepID=UPI00367C756A
MHSMRSQTGFWSRRHITPGLPFARERKYTEMRHRNVGRQGLELPLLSLGLSSLFDRNSPLGEYREVMLHAFDKGIVSFDLSTTCGALHPAVEEIFGIILNRDLRPYRESLVVSTRVGYGTAQRVNGWGSQKFITESLERSLHRAGLDYVDIFYAHRYDPSVPLEETMQALASAVYRGRCLRVGISAYPSSKIEQAKALLSELGVPLCAYRGPFSLFQQWGKMNLAEMLSEAGIGWISTDPLNGGILSTCTSSGPTLTRESIESSTEVQTQLSCLSLMAAMRGQSIEQMAISWVVNHPWISSVVVDVSSRRQLDAVAIAACSAGFTGDELASINSMTVHCQKLGR